MSALEPKMNMVSLSAWFSSDITSHEHIRNLQFDISQIKVPEREKLNVPRSGTEVVKNNNNKKIQIETLNGMSVLLSILS